jgi:Ca-activated chloride channel family protein
MIMSFAKPLYLLALLSVPLFVLFFWWAGRAQQNALNRLGNKDLIARLTASVHRPARRGRKWLWLAALSLFILALARPQWGTVTQEVKQEGLQVMIALDVSQSMLAEDIKPTRLDRAKLEIADLMNRLNGDEVGLVLFSGASFIQVPLTSDYFTAQAYLDSAGPEVISRPGTVIGEAIRTALTGFDPNLSSQKVLILMTDGEDRETDPLAAAEMAAAEDVIIYTIGFGTPQGEPVPETNANGEIIGYKQDGNGQVAISRLDENTLQAIARVGNGRYFTTSADGSELDALLAEIDGLQRTQLQSRVETRFIERYQLFLALGLVLLLIAEILPDRRKTTPRVMVAA